MISYIAIKYWQSGFLRVLSGCSKSYYTVTVPIYVDGWQPYACLQLQIHMYQIKYGIQQEWLYSIAYQFVNSILFYTIKVLCLKWPLVLNMAIYMLIFMQQDSTYNDLFRDQLLTSRICPIMVNSLNAACIIYSSKKYFIGY